MERVVVIDFETAKNPYPCQIGVTIIENGEITDTFMRYIKPPKNEYNPHCIEIHGITPEVTENAPETTVETGDYVTCGTYTYTF